MPLSNEEVIKVVRDIHARLYYTMEDALDLMQALMEHIFASKLNICC